MFHHPKLSFKGITPITDDVHAAGGWVDWSTGYANKLLMVACTSLANQEVGAREKGSVVEPKSSIQNSVWFPIIVKSDSAGVIQVYDPSAVNHNIYVVLSVES